MPFSGTACNRTRNSVTAARASSTRIWITSFRICRSSMLPSSPGGSGRVRSRGTERAAVDLPQPDRREEQLQLAMTFNELAETRSNGLLGSAPLWKQRAHLATLLGNRSETARLLERIKQAPDRGTRDLYLTA